MLAVQPDARAQIRPDTLVTIGSGAVDGVYHPAAGALCRLLNLRRIEHGIRCVIDVTRGSVDNLERLADGTADFGLVQTDVQAAAVQGTGRFAGFAPAENLRALFSVHAEPLTVVARLDAGIRTFADLRGKRVSIGETGSGTWATMRSVMTGFGIDVADLGASMHLGPAEAAEALCENVIDAFAFVVGHPNRSIRVVSESCAVRLVPVSGEEVQALLQAYRHFSSATIPGGLYVGSDDPVPTLGVRASLLTRADTPEPIAYEMTRAAFENLERLRRLHPAFMDLDPERMLAGHVAPYHPGAMRYFAEVGMQPPAATAPAR